jgi:hypothetical protein
MAACVFPGQWASGAIFEDPTPGGLLVKEIELQNADMYGQPFTMEAYLMTLMEYT